MMYKECLRITRYQVVMPLGMWYAAYVNFKLAEYVLYVCTLTSLDHLSSSSFVDLILVMHTRYA